MLMLSLTDLALNVDGQITYLMTIHLNPLFSWSTAHIHLHAHHHSSLLPQPLLLFFISLLSPGNANSMMIL